MYNETIKLRNIRYDGQYSDVSEGGSVKVSWSGWPSN